MTTVRSFTNGLYTGTTHTLVWSDKLRPVFAITAAFDDRKHDGGARGERWFCDAAEQAWADYIVPRLVAQIDAGQRARFSLGGDDRLELTNDAIYAYRSGLEIRYTPGELAPITVESGILTITRAGEKPKLRIGPDSGVRVEYGAVGNAAAFLALARQLFGSAVVP